MKLGITLTPGLHACSNIAKAEAAGFASAFFVDSPVLFGDPYVSMAVAAAQTERIVLGVGVTNPLTRSAPVTAAVFASLNMLAPGRVVLGIGTGYTATRAMGQRSATVEELERYVGAMRRLFGGDIAEVELSGKTVPVQFLNRTSPWVNLVDRVPIYIAAAGPRILALAGRVADGVILGGAADEGVIGSCRRHIEEGARQAGRPLGEIDLTVTASMYVTERTPTFEELRAALGPMSFITAVTYARFLEAADGVSRDLRRDVDRARRAYEQHNAADADRGTQHLRRYGGHRQALEPWQVPLVTEALLDATTIVGTVEQCYAKIRRLEACGIRQLLAVTLPENLDAVIDGCGRTIIPRLSAAAA